MQTRTLEELDVKPGDVVEYMPNGSWYPELVGRHMTVRDDGGVSFLDRYGQQDGFGVYCSHRFRVISSAQPTPTLWRNMTPEQKGAMLLAAHERKVIEYIHACSSGWHAVDWKRETIWYNDTAYRIRPEPKRETVTMHTDGKSVEVWDFFSIPTVTNATNRITFTTIDGVPDCASVKMDAI